MLNISESLGHIDDNQQKQLPSSVGHYNDKESVKEMERMTSLTAVTTRNQDYPQAQEWGKKTD